MNKRRRLRAIKRSVEKAGAIERVEDQKLVMRFVSMRADTADAQNRRVEVVIATENPVERYDKERGLVVREVLAMDGVEFRGGRNQLPIVDSHDRTTVRNVYGSVRNVRVEGDELIGDAMFADDAESQTAFRKLLDGHLTDFSITAQPREIGFVERGKSYTTRRGEVVEGPADIVTRWMPTDASLCATGADERSTVRRSYTDIPEGKREMNESLLSALHSLGMPEGLTEPDVVAAWMVGNLNAVQPAMATEPMPEPVESADLMPEEDQPMADVENADAMASEEETQNMDTKDMIEKAIKDDQRRRNEIRAAVQKAGLQRSFADELCDNHVPLDIARQKIIDKIGEGNQPLGTTTETVVRSTESEDDKFAAAARDGLVQRAFQAAGLNRQAFGEGRQPAPGAEDFQHLGLRRLAERCVRRMGVNTDRMADKDIAMVALGQPGAINRYHISRDAYHTTGSFPQLLLDAANKTLLAAYDEAEFTWNVWARQAASVPDFKNINRIRFSEAPDLEHVVENHEYKEGEMSDAKETYNVEKFGRIFTVTWETVVNDDMDAISRIPAMQGNAARRTQNKKVYEVLTANANMADGNPLFDGSNHGNNADASDDPSVSTLNTAFTAMRTQTGLDGSTIINVQPRFIIVPTALAATTMQLLNSIADPSVGGSAAGNANTHNIYGPGGGRRLTMVEEPQLDGNSTSVWYLAADSRQIDTVELSFLQGEESPVLENEWDFDKDCYKYKIRQTFGVKAIDWRGLYRYAA